MLRLAETVARLWARGAPTAVEAKASATGPLIVLETLGRPVWTPRDYEAFAREGFMQNAIVYRAVRMIAEAAASVPLMLFEDGSEHEQHPLLDLLARPSLDQTGTDFLEAWYGYLLVAGNAYVEAVGLDGRVRELHALRPDRMKVVPGSEGWPEAYEYTCAGRMVRFEEEAVAGVRPILHLRLFHPANDHYGMSPVEAAAQAIDIHNTAGHWNKALLDNSARPSGALVYGGADGRMTPEQFERLKAELEDGFQGPRRAGRPLLLEGGLDWKPLSLSPKDMDFIAARNGAAREIALAFGVPPMLLGIPGDNTFSNYQEAQRAFWRSTVLPLVTRTAKALASWLGPAWHTDLDLRPDLDQIEALTSEREALWARIEKVSFLTLNEKRAAVGYAPLEEPPPARATEIDPSIVVRKYPADRGRKCPAEGERKYRPDQARAPRGDSDGGQWVDEGGGSGGGGGSGSSDNRSLSDANSDEADFWTPGVRVAQADESSHHRIDLLEHEGRSGAHTIKEHVGKDDAYLLARTRGERGPYLIRRRVGSFPSLEAANKLVSATLASSEREKGQVLSNRERVERVARGEVGGDFITLEFSKQTGREAFAPSELAEPYLRDTYGVGVVIVHDNTSKTGFTVFNAYPRNPD